MQANSMSQMLTLITSPEGLRLCNLIFVDQLVFPPNFMCARPVMLGEGFEQHIEKQKDIPNCAYLNASDGWVNNLLPEHVDGVFGKGEFKAVKIHSATFDTYDTWKITYQDKEAEIKFIHELQNYYQDWVGELLIDDKDVK